MLPNGNAPRCVAAAPRVGLDALDVAVNGRFLVRALAFERLGPSHQFATDILRDGTLEGPNYDAIETMLTVTDIPIIISGGIGEATAYKMADAGAQVVAVLLTGMGSDGARGRIRRATAPGP